jgi:hypothetical protein
MGEETNQGRCIGIHKNYLTTLQYFWLMPIWLCGKPNRERESLPMVGMENNWGSSLLNNREINK